MMPLRIVAPATNQGVITCATVQQVVFSIPLQGIVGAAASHIFDVQQRVGANLCAQSGVLRQIDQNGLRHIHITDGIHIALAIKDVGHIVGALEEVGTAAAPDVFNADQGLLDGTIPGGRFCRAPQVDRNCLGIHCPRIGQRVIHTIDALTAIKNEAGLEVIEQIAPLAADNFFDTDQRIGGGLGADHLGTTHRLEVNREGTGIADRAEIGHIGIRNAQRAAAAAVEQISAAKGV